MRKIFSVCSRILLVAIALPIHSLGIQSQAPPATAQPQTQSSPNSAKSAGKKNPEASKENRENFNWYSMDLEVKLGVKLAEQVNARLTFISDPAVTGYVSQVGQNLVRNSDPKFSFTIKVFDSPEARAFALPGGLLYVSSGLLLKARNEAEMAAIMAHAIAHVNARHVTRLLSKSAFINGDAKLLLQDYCNIYAMCEKDVPTANPPSFKFSRNFEKEADWLGVQYLYKAGYDPIEFVTFLEERKQEEDSISPRVAELPSHPPLEERIAVTSKEILGILPQRNRYITNTSEFEQIKARLVKAVLPQHAEKAGPQLPAN
jgi:predicted Zn-dependent protease